MKLVLASKNKKKLVEMNDILSHLGIEVCSEAEAGVDVDVEETGTTFEENSLLKAKAVMEASGLPAIADDSGLCVDALGGAPGVYSARYGGEGLDDVRRYQLLLENMKGQSPRTAKFVSVITCCFPNGDVLSARGECAGTIAFAPMGEGGFGYDPVFFVPELKKTFSQLTAEEKNAISHRGKALKAFQVKLADYLKNPAPTAVFLFVETQVDKRSRMFKAVRETGRAVEFATQTEETLKKWILGQIRREGKKISEETLNRFLTMTGTDMEQISSELEKLFCYTLNRDVITREDVDAVCVRQISSRIFEMVESMALRRQQQTLKLYYDLLSLKEPPMRILYLIGRQFNLLLQVKALKKTGSDDRTIAEKTGLRGFLVKKYASQASRFSRRELQEALAACAEADESVKTGRMGDRMCVELLLIRYSAEKTKGRSQTWET